MKSLMIQGTGSYIGKSLIVAGLYRIFRKNGFNVVPFKSQKILLNSFAINLKSSRDLSTPIIIERRKYARGF